MRLSVYARKIGVTYQTAYKHYRKGIIQGYQLPTGTILVDYSEDNKENLIKKENKVALYARVSSSENKSNLKSQLDRLRDFATAKGYTIVEEISEIGSGINSKRKKLLNLLKKDTYSILLVEHKDRFARFGIEIVKELLDQLNKKLEIINETNSDKEDLVQDLISIITSFSAKLYGQRRSNRKTESIINHLKNYDKEKNRNNEISDNKRENDDQKEKTKNNRVV